MDHGKIKDLKQNGSKHSPNLICSCPCREFGGGGGGEPSNEIIRLVFVSGGWAARVSTHACAS
jgi:hypothetical protein